ncbi:MAG: uridine diphosphate-N-acetylglucosamine-binding protein YvcK [Candidatus Paceibacterota bacterium]
MSETKKKLVTIGGGSGQYVLLSGIRDVASFDITAVVSMADSGGSTGRLRDKYGVLPPGDILKCILALSPYRDSAREILQKRFEKNQKLAKHSLGNMLLTMLSRYVDDFAEGVEALGDVLEIQGEVLPVTTDKATLVAELTDGSWLFGESAIDVPRGGQKEKIKRTLLVPHHSDSIKVYPEVLEKIKRADYIIFGPGDLYTSIIPNLLVEGVKEEISRSDAELIYIANIMTKFGETEGFGAQDLIETLEDHLPRRFDKVILNNSSPGEDILQKYKEQKSSFIEPPHAGLGEREVIVDDILSVLGGVVRHDPQKLASLLKKVL